MCADLWVRGKRLGILLPFGMFLDVSVIHRFYCSVIPLENVENVKKVEDCAFQQKLCRARSATSWLCKKLDKCCVSQCTSHPWVLQCPGQHACCSPLQLASWEGNAVVHSPHCSLSSSIWILNFKFCSWWRRNNSWTQAWGNCFPILLFFHQTWSHTQEGARDKLVFNKLRGC